MSRSLPLFSAFRPTAADPFDRIKAAHLLNRAGFGGTPQEIEQLVELGPEKSVDLLLDFPDQSAEEQNPDDTPDLSSIEGFPRTFAARRQLLAGKTEQERTMLIVQLQRGNFQAIRATMSWWLKRMATHHRPLQEKLTLFWHGHFTTSARDERSAWLMWQQNETLRRNAAGNFRTFLQQISRDPAMLDYLNNQQNRRGSPNENYARELMELFTLGIGHYTEQDIKEAARAFTGWGHDGEQYTFRRNFHDPGEKVFFGRRGNFNGDDIIDIILEHRVAPTYLANKLWSFFAYEDPEPVITREMGELLRRNKWELRPVLRAMFLSRAFYSHRAIGTQIKSPVQLIVGTVRLLEVPMPQATRLQRPLEQMGQVPFYPPNVKGWPSGRAWINTSTLLARYNTCLWLAGGTEDRRPRRGGAIQVQTDGPPQRIVDTWIARLIQRPISEDRRQILIDTLGRRPSEESVRQMVQLIVSMPEYQLC